MGLADQVDQLGVQALLIGRPSDVLQSHQALYERTLVGVSAEVAAVAGEAPPEQVLALAVWCVSLGVAASLESALYPEQQLGDEGRAKELRARFLGVLASLRLAMTPSSGSSGVALAGSYSVSGQPLRTLDVPWWP